MTRIYGLISITVVVTLTFCLPNSSANNISPFETIFSTNFVIVGTGGMRGVGTGSFTVSGISGVITKAYLYWHGPTDSTDRRANATVTLDGNTVVGQNIGLSNDNCWGFDNSHAYRADVTDLVEAKGNGIYTLSNFTKPNRIDINGVTLLVFYYDDDLTNDRDVVVFEGNDSNIANSYDELGWNVTLTRIEYVSGTANMHLVVGDGQDWLDDALKINGQTVIPRGQIFRGDLGPRTHNGSLWDIKTINVTPYLSSGLNTLSLTTGTYSDCLSLVVAVVDLPAGAAPCNIGESATTSTLWWTESCALSDAKTIPLAWRRNWLGFPIYEDELESDLGEKLELECYGSYQLYYTSPTGQRNRVGKCPFFGGCNIAYFTHTGDEDNDGNPDCFGRVFWKSKDYYSNDIPNPWTGEQDEDPPRFDVAVTIFDAGTSFLTKKSFKYEYGPGETSPPDWPHNCDSYQTHALVSVLEVDPRVGPETEAFFDAVDERMTNVADPDTVPMTGSPFSPADLNRDGVEDSLDLQIFEQALGTCQGEELFNPEADFNQDGCVTDADYNMMKDMSTADNKSPTANAGSDQTEPVGPDCMASITLNGSGSSDPDGDALIYSWTWDSGSDEGVNPTIQLPLGTTTITLIVNDGTTNSDPDTVVITTVDQTPPAITLNGPPELSLECGLDTYTELGATASDNCDPTVAVTIGGDTVNTSTCGTYVVTYDATDSSGNTAQVTREVTVIDTTPPEISLSVTPDTLWPPNHKLVAVTPGVIASDNCDVGPIIALESVTMNEGEETNTYDPNYDSTAGDGHTVDDIQVDANGTIYLRAERSGTGSGRIYTIVYSATDASENTSSATATVTVPHNQ